MFVFLWKEKSKEINRCPYPMLEEHHHYPTGLEMFALSSSAGNGYVRNRYGYQGQERKILLRST